MATTKTEAEYARHLAYVQRYNAKKKDDPVYKEQRKKAYRKWQQRFPEKRQAHIIVGHAVRSGKLIKPSACEWCGTEGRVQAHHKDYSKPLDVEWVCSGCHGKEHRGIH